MHSILKKMQYVSPAARQPGGFARLVSNIASIYDIAAYIDIVRLFARSRASSIIRDANPIKTTVNLRHHIIIRIIRPPNDTTQRVVISYTCIHVFF